MNDDFRDSKYIIHVIPLLGSFAAHAPLIHVNPRCAYSYTYDIFYKKYYGRILLMEQW